MKRSHELAEVASFRRYGALLLAGVALSPLAVQAAGSDAEATHTTQAQPSDERWQLAWSDKFTGSALGERWNVIDNTSTVWEDRFSQYRPFGVKVRGDDLVLTSRRHCLSPGEDMTLANAQTEACAPGLTTSYSAGRVEQAVSDIGGDYKITVKVKMPLGKIGTREAIWMNNIQEIGQPNGGYCIEGSSESNDEKDLVEWYGDRKVRASHHMHCENGDLAEVPRAKKISVKQTKKYNEYSVTRIGNKTEFFVNDEPIPLLENKKESVDTPRDFNDVTRDEYRATRQYLEGMIFCTRVFDDPEAPNPLFRAPSPIDPFQPRHMKIDEISVYTLVS